MSSYAKMAQPESSFKLFKVCGLCTSLVSESVRLNENLRQFLEEFLGLETSSDLPAKVCTDCCQSAVDSLKFKEKVIKGVQELKNTEISVSMILGRSASDMQLIKKAAKTKVKNVEEPTETSTPVPKVAKIAEVRRNLGNAINESTESVFDFGPTSTTRHSGRIPIGMPSVVLSKKDRENAENFINRPSSGRTLKRKNPYSPPKVAETTPAASTSRSKQSRVLGFHGMTQFVKKKRLEKKRFEKKEENCNVCVVCGDNTLRGPYLGVQCCKKCMHFVYNRTVNRRGSTMTYVCKKNGNCIIHYTRKQNCAACRFMKWLDAKEDLNKRKKKEAVVGLEASKRSKTYETSKKKQKLTPEAQPIKYKKKTPKKNRSFDEDDGDGSDEDMSDESSASEEEIEKEQELKGVDQDQGLSTTLDSDDSDSDEEKKKKEGEKSDDEKKKKGNSENGNSSDEEGEKGKKKKGSANSSRSTTPTKDVEKHDKAEKRKAMVANLLDPNASNVEPEPKQVPDYPFTYLIHLKQTMDKFPTRRLVTTVKATITTIASKISIQKSDAGYVWHVSVMLNDGSASLQADISDFILSSRIEQAAAVIAIPDSDVASKTRVNEKVKEFGQWLAKVSGLFSLRVEAGRPLVEDIDQVRVLQLRQLMRRRLQ